MSDEGDEEGGHAYETYEDPPEDGWFWDLMSPPTALLLLYVAALVGCFVWAARNMP